MSYNLIGKRFGKLVVLRKTDKRKNDGCIIWECKCDCGNLIKISTTRFNKKHRSTKSCGCLHKEKIITHDKWGTSTYNSWKSMKQRCLNENNVKFTIYGGRGIMICERWIVFENFFADMGERPEGMTLDRIDNDGHYELDNCRWATPIVQRHNRRIKV